MKFKGGLLSGKDPSAYNPSDPIRLWIIQVGKSCLSLQTHFCRFNLDVLLTGLIVGMASLLSLGLRKIRQPKVIAEVLGGILLGSLYPPLYARFHKLTKFHNRANCIRYVLVFQ